MKEKCAKCGEIEKVSYEFRREDIVWGFRLPLCYDCGEKVEKFINSEGKPR